MVCTSCFQMLLSLDVVELVFSIYGWSLVAVIIFLYEHVHYSSFAASGLVVYSYALTPWTCWWSWGTTRFHGCIPGKGDIVTCIRIFQLHVHLVCGVWHVWTGYICLHIHNFANTMPGRVHVMGMSWLQYHQAFMTVNGSMEVLRFISIANSIEGVLLP